MAATEHDRSDDFGVNYSCLWLDGHKFSRYALGGEHVLYCIGKIGFLRVVEGDNIPTFFDGTDGQLLAKLRGLKRYEIGFIKIVSSDVVNRRNRNFRTESLP